MKTLVKDHNFERHSHLFIFAPGRRFGGRQLWRGRCDCGNIVDDLRIDQLTRVKRRKTSCGCRLAEVKQEFGPNRASDLFGQPFGRLTAIAPMPERSANRHIRWYCVCSCGGETVVDSDKLVSESVKSCGCYRLEILAEGREIYLTRSRANHSKLWVGLFTKPYIRPRKTRKINRLDEVDHVSSPDSTGSLSAWRKSGQG